MVTNVYVSSVKYAAVAQFAINTAYTLGQYIRQLAAPAAGNERVFKCTTAGTTGGSEPSWNLGNNATTTSGTATFTQVGGQEANQSAGNWTAPLANINTAATLITAGFGVRVFVHSDHVETVAASATYSSGNCDFTVSVNPSAATLPPVDSDYQRGAQIITTGNNNLNIQSGLYQGFDFKCGTGSGGASIGVGNGNFVATGLDDCTLQLLNTNSGNTVTFESTPTFPGHVRMRRTKIKFSATGQNIQLSNAADVEWYDTPSGAVDSGGSIPTNLFTFPSNTPHRRAIFHGLDLSAVNTTMFTGAVYAGVDMWDCKLHASVTLPTNKDANDPLAYFSIVNCDDSTNARNFRYYYASMGMIITSDTLAVADSGATDGVTQYSHRFDIQLHGGGAPNHFNPVVGPWISRRYNTTGASKTATIEVIGFRQNSLGAFVDTELWAEFEVLDNSGVPLCSTIRTRQASPMGTGTANTTSSKAWDTGGVAARQNSHAYVVGDLIKLASNTGRIFMCIQAGTSNGSEPGGYATAADGDQVTDSGAIFVAGRRMKLQATFTQAVKGIVRARIMGAFLNGLGSQGTRINVDPKIDIA